MVELTMHSLKRCRQDDEDAEAGWKKVSTSPSTLAKDHPLIQLVEQRRNDVYQLLDHISKLQEKLVVAKKKLLESRTMLKQLQSRTDEETENLGLNTDFAGDRQGKIIARSGVSTPASGAGNPSRSLAAWKGDAPEGSRTTSSDSTQLHLHVPISRSEGVAQAAKGKIDVQKAHERTSLSGGKVSGGRERVQEDNVELISKIKTTQNPISLTFTPSVYIPSERKRKLRCLEVNPAGQNQCATSALDGILSFWQIDGQGHGLSLQHSVDCLSPGQRRWPEDLDWHPSGDSLVACYAADNGDSQVSVIKNTERKKAIFLPDKPHEKGIINGIVFLPWSSGREFITGGCDHAVVLWNQRDDESWQTRVLHRAMHTSAVMGVAAVSHRKWVLSSGADKRVFAYDLEKQKAPINHQLDTKAISVVPNPVDCNIYMVQTGTPGKQLKLFDIRAPKTQLHSFGWSQESSESQTALIRSVWSPDGLCTVSGSTDPKIHIFDIRYDRPDPVMTLRAHTKRVFKAAWHHSLPTLISISSDLQIGLHRLWKK